MSLLQRNVSPHRCPAAPGCCAVSDRIRRCFSYGGARCTQLPLRRVSRLPGGPGRATCRAPTPPDTPRPPHAVASSSPPPASAAATPRLALTTAEPEHQLSPTENLEAQAWSKAGTAARRAKARAKRYEGEMRSKCRELRAGAEWCDKCGGTTGTSAITVAVVVKTAIAAPGIVPPLQACPRCRAK